MPKDIARISKVKAVGPSTIEVTWKGGGIDRIELTAWVGTGNSILASLRDPAVFKTARVGLYGSMIAWADNDDLAIDALHLQRIVDEQRGQDT
jgi:hypothetical protein